MTTLAKRNAMMERIQAHGRALLAMFPNATVQEPVKLCTRLRRLEVQANTAAVQWCNGALEADQWERTSDALRAKACKALGTDRVWVNSDPRGYALKIHLQPGEELHRDWGGYGIVAPDLS